MDEDICEDCGHPYPFLQKAHIVARHKGGTDDPDNIIRICPNCHFIRDYADRIGWLKRRWESIPPEVRSEEQRQRMAAMPEKVRVARNQKIARTKTGSKYKPSVKPRGPKVWTAETLVKRGASMKAAWAAKTPEEREAWRLRCSEIKQAAAAVAAKKAR